MKEALLKKRYGIPALVLVILMASGTVAAGGVFAFYLSSAVRYPTHESVQIDMGNIAAGESASGSDVGFLGLPNASYDLSWSLSGDLEKFSSVTIKVTVDLNDDGEYTEEEVIGTLSKTKRTISKTGVSGVLKTTAKYDVSVTVKNGAEKAGTSIASDPTTLNVDWNASKAA